MERPTSYLSKNLSRTGTAIMTACIWDISVCRMALNFSDSVRTLNWVRKPDSTFFFYEFHMHQWHRRRCVSYDRELLYFTIARFYFLFCGVGSLSRFTALCELGATDCAWQAPRHKHRSANITMKHYSRNDSRGARSYSLGEPETSTICSQTIERRRTVNFRVSHGNWESLFLSVGNKNKPVYKYDFYLMSDRNR